MSHARIPATVITGFLGSGKTTLIRNIIMQANGKRLALIVNEFGDIGMDGDMLQECGADSCRAEDIIELANGCICCTVADDFLPSIQTLLAQDPPPDHIVIETSGLALPQPLVQAFGWPDIKSQVMLDGVVTLVDGPALAKGGIAHDLEALEAQRKADEELDHESPIDELFEDQILAANLIVISKSDMLDDAGIARAQAMVESHLDEPTPIISVAGGVAPMDAILGLDMEDQAHARAAHAHHHHHHHHDDDDDEDHHHEHDHGHDEFASFIIAMGVIDSAETLTAKLADMAGQHGILRAKGRLQEAGKALPLVVQAVGKRVDSYYARDTEAKVGQLVVIGLAGLDGVAIATQLGGSLANASS
ncbi:cobalamin biosynthesis protein CobW [Candidatus Puniceispirillum sp.]|mgnify:CR=1 FL=1|jgi:cobalamin biosynthesis protein CobW|uniref:cobalamin biosynthesis protein CobW n=2 Tax=Candidatus Puniceispirillum TaxID=767891 RepID=UPI001EC2D8FE|nr:cobalamin biosynthesis protein CobW [Candidatus Puniceispirillum sp.]MBT6567263.1 cobalamin biosynthesis protein CobW [Candidatus Puniceispirillum sp.]